MQPATRQKKLFAPWSIGPLIATLGCLAAWAETVNPPYLGYLAFAAGAGFLAGVLYFFYQFLGRIVCGQWLGACFAVMRIILCVAATVPAVGRTLFLGAMWDEQQDHFADHLTIPSNIEISRPIPSLDFSAPGKDDQFQRQVLAALQKPAGNSPTLTPSVPSLRILAQNHRELLMRYLESSPAWRVYEGRGGLFAARRWQFGTQWISTLTDMYWQADPEGRGNLNGTRTNFDLRPFCISTARLGCLPSVLAGWMKECLPVRLV